MKYKASIVFDEGVDAELDERVTTAARSRRDQAQVKETQGGDGPFDLDDSVLSYPGPIPLVELRSLGKGAKTARAGRRVTTSIS